MQRLGAHLYGPLTGLGLAAALVACLIDQAAKVWLLRVFDIADRGSVPLLRVLDLHLVWNRGISYGLFQDGNPQWQWVLLIVKAVAVVLLWSWLAHTRSRLAALALGLIIGGALGNAIDRFAYGAVADFVHFHVGGFSWYVFNGADVAIVAGVVGLLYESLFVHSAAPAPGSGR